MNQRTAPLAIAISLFIFVTTAILLALGKITSDKALLIQSATIFTAGCALDILAWRIQGWFGRTARILGVGMVIIAIATIVITLQKSLP